jgi:hypothetical protein
MGSLKAGLENTTGPFVVFLKAGDLLRPQFIGRHVAAHLNGAYSAGLSACDTIQIDMEGRILEGTHFSVDKHRSDYSSSPVRPILLSAQNLIRKDELLINAPIEHPVYYVDRLAERSTGASISCHMFRRDLLDLMMPSEPGSLLVGADHYLVVLAHKITGTLTLWDQLVYSRVRRNEDAAHEVILGGPNPSSTLAAETRARVEGQIPIHIAAHFDQIFRVVGPKIVDVVHRYCPPDQLEALRERFPAIKPFIVMQKKSPPKRKKKRWYRLLPNRKWVPGGLRRR